MQPNEPRADVDQALGALLLKRGKLDQHNFERAWRWHEERDQRLSVILTSLGLVSERDMAAFLSEILGASIAAPRDYESSTVIESDGLSIGFLRHAKVFPLETNEDGIVLAMADPLDAFSRMAVELKFGRPVSIRVAVPSELEQALDSLAADGKSSIDQIVETIGSGDDGVEEDAERLKDLASEAPVIRLVNLLISNSVEARASDIHIEPFENRLRVRYRIDGVLHDVESPPAKLRFAVISRVKIMARLNIAERRLPQDGRIRLVVRGKEIDLRVSTVPTMYGEKAVLRVLDKSRGVLEFSDLGFDDTTLARYTEMFRRPNGIVLVTGPTGSGKTTTLYASLVALNDPDKNIVTVEDPVEYQLDGVNQIQVKPQIGLNFGSVLRSILRQDPDIIMIGEIRDLETATIAVQASLTGHLVLSTLHTNSAASTITRLLDMGVDDYLLTSTISGVVAQRLVRSLCPDCKQPYEALDGLVDQLQLRRLTDAEAITLYRPTGCETCNGTGYFGRSSIAEVLSMSESLQAMVLNHAEAREIHRQAAADGMRSMYEDGMLKALKGLTSVEEVMRVIREI